MENNLKVGLNKYGTEMYQKLKEEVRGFIKEESEIYEESLSKLFKNR